MDKFTPFEIPSMIHRSLAKWLTQFVSTPSKTKPPEKKQPKLEVLQLEDRVVPAGQLGLGIAADYNAFVFNNFTSYTSETEGRLAIGHDATLSNYGVGVRLTQPTGSRPDLIVGNNLTYTDGQVFHGDIVYGGSANLTRIGLPEGTAKQGSVINFAQAENELKYLSSTYAALPTNGKVTKQWGSIVLEGTNAQQNVFNLTAADFNPSYGLTIKVPKGSMVIINISGQNVALQYFGFQLQGADASKILFNMPQAKNVTIQGIGIEGSILAPSATVNFNNGNIRGTLVCQNFTGYGELRYVPPKICVCEPNTQKSSLTGSVHFESKYPGGSTGKLPNVTVILTGTTAQGTVNKTTTTDKDGYFVFSELDAGVYSISMIVPPGYSPANGTPGNVGGVGGPSSITNINLATGTQGYNYNISVYNETVSAMKQAKIQVASKTPVASHLLLQTRPKVSKGRL